MKILFVDTTTPDLVAAIVEENKVYDFTQTAVGVKHSELICTVIENALMSLCISFSQLDAYACSIGPGSFTGIRIGISTLKGFRAAVRKPFIAVNCLEAIANSENCGKCNSAVINAGNGYYFADYENGVEPCLISYDDDRVKYCGKANGAAEYLDGAVQIIRKRYSDGNFDNDLKPLYIRKSQAEERKNDKKT